MPNPADTLTLADLKKWDRLDEKGNYLPSLAVLGHPVAHSVSPQMHNAALQELAKKYPQLKDWGYFKFDVDTVELGNALDPTGELAKKNFKGLNLTVPHKSDAAAILSGYNVSLGSEEGKDVVQLNDFFFVNTVTFSARLKADNTDDYGLIQAIKRQLKLDLFGKTVVLLGTGGAASAVANKCVAERCAALWVSGRDETKRLMLIERVNQYINSVIQAPNISPAQINGFDISTPPYETWPDDVIVINATTLGLKLDDVLPIDVAKLGERASVMDMVYNRGGPTKLVQGALGRGLHATDGVGMLVWQGAKSLSIWLQAEGIDVKPEAVARTMMDAACQALDLPPRHA
jgi:shikimate dehydrogenase